MFKTQANNITTTINIHISALQMKALHAIGLSYLKKKRKIAHFKSKISKKKFQKNMITARFELAPPKRPGP